MDWDSFLKTYGFENLDIQQQQAVKTTNGPILLLAVPGSGKTTTLVARLGYLIYGIGVDPKKILTMTYTVAATKEMRERFSKRFGPQYANDFECRTINGLCCKIIEAYARRGHTPPRLVQEQEQSAIIRTAWSQLALGFPTEQDIKAAKIFIANIKNRMVRSDEEMKQLAALFSQEANDVDFVHIYKRYQEILTANRYMDYDDQMVFANAILKKEPGIRSLFQNKYQHIFVDEAQDTSRIQNAIITILAAKHRNLFVVGDEDQSIYGFRAANPEELLTFEKQWPGAKVLFIETNYRSTPEIVAAASRVITKNKERRNKKMAAKNPSGAEVSTIPCVSRIKQYELLTRLAKEAANTGEDLAILYRNNETALPIIDSLSKAHIPYKAKAIDTMFFSTREYLDVKAFFSLAYNNEDTDAFLRVYSKISGLYLSRQTAVAITAQGGNIIDGLWQSGGNRRRISEVVNAFQSIKYMDAIHGIREIRYTLGYDKWLERQGNNTFRMSILEILATHDKTAKAFIQHMEGPGGLKEVITNGSSGAGCVLSTIHSSKGLEYDHVILADVVDKIFPSADAIEEAKSGDRAPTMEEERRIFYVGATRAKEKLEIITFANGTSRFAEDLLGKPLKKDEPDSKSAQKRALAWQHTVGITEQKMNPASNKVDFAVNDRVIHAVFGIGTVTSSEPDRVTVFFDESQKTKSFMPSFVINTGLMDKLKQ